MKLRNILQLAGLVAVICGCSTQQPIAAPASATGYRQGPVTAEGSVVATRRFQRVLQHLGRTQKLARLKMPVWEDVLRFRMLVDVRTSSWSPTWKITNGYAMEVASLETMQSQTRLANPTWC